MGAHHRRDSTGAAMDRPAFDEVAQGYDRGQVDDYLGVLWRYASEVTSRAAAAEAALRHERDRREAEARLADSVPAQAGGRIGLMLEIAQREADDIIAAARQIAQSALEEAIAEAGTSHPIVREAREQAEKLLLDAVEESRRIALTRHEDLEAQIARGTHSLDALRRQQGEIVGAVLRLRRLLGEDEIDRAVTDLVRSGLHPDDLAGPAAAPPAGPAPTGAQRPAAPHSGVPRSGFPRAGAGPGGDTVPPGAADHDVPGATGYTERPGAGPYAAGPTVPGPAVPGAAAEASAAGAGSTAGSSSEAAGRVPQSSAGFSSGGARYTATGANPTGAVSARRGPGRHRQPQRDVAEAEPYPTGDGAGGFPAGGAGPLAGGRGPVTANVPAAGYRPGHEEDIIDAEIVEE